MKTVRDLKNELENNSSVDEKVKKEKYLLNQFKFIGLKKSDITYVSKPYIQYWKTLSKDEIFNICDELVYSDFREMMYVAYDLLYLIRKTLDENDLINLTEKYVTYNSWWENTDSFNKILYVRNKDFSKTQSNKMTTYFLKHESKWVNRLSLIMWLKNPNYNQKALIRSINKLSSNKDFFIQKAIGWTVRDLKVYDDELMNIIIKLNDDKNWELTNVALKEIKR